MSPKPEILERNRRILALRDKTGWSYQKIAVELGIPKPRVWQIIKKTDRQRRINLNWMRI